MREVRINQSEEQTKVFIENLISKFVKQSPYKTTYGVPIMGYGSAHNPLFSDLKELIAPDHLLPFDLLPSAKTVVSFYLPFASQIIKDNLNNSKVTPEWALAYEETNRLLEDICLNLSRQLHERGIKSAYLPPTNNFNRETLVSTWSHKHVAYICGLGNFGLHRMLITERGCAGRLTSLVLDYPLHPTNHKSKAYCLYSRNEKCLKCIESCPSGALSTAGLAKETCYQHLIEMDSTLSGQGFFPVCGKCLCACPHAFSA